MIVLGVALVVFQAVRFLPSRLQEINVRPAIRGISYWSWKILHTVLMFPFKYSGNLCQFDW